MRKDFGKTNLNTRKKVTVRKLFYRQYSFYDKLVDGTPNSIDTSTRTLRLFRNIVTIDKHITFYITNKSKFKLEYKNKNKVRCLKTFLFNVFI